MPQAKRDSIRKWVAEINSELKNKNAKMLLDVEFSDGRIKFYQATPEQLEKKYAHAQLVSIKFYGEAELYLKGYFHSLMLINWN